MSEPLLITDQKQQTKCYHCSDTCLSDNIKTDDKHFCCYGCQTVFDILECSDLTSYYELETAPGSTIEALDQNKYDFLDNIEIQEQLLDFNSESLQKTTFTIPAIHCSSCIWLLENIARLDQGIYSSQINFSKKKISIDFNPTKTSLRKVVELLSRIGYEPMINLKSLDREEIKQDNSLYLKIGVAGFCFGNIMLLSFPDYLGLQVSPQLNTYFIYLGFVLSLPVLCYSSIDYFVSAYNGLKERFSNIDIPIALGIMVLFLRSTYEIFVQGGMGYFDSLSGLIFFLLIGRWIQSKTYDGLSFDRDYSSYFPLAIIKIDGQERNSVPVYKLQTGDEILIRNGEIIPSDSVLLSDTASIDYSFVTGEAIPVACNSGDKIYAGGKLVGASRKFGVIKPVSQSYLTQLWNMAEVETKQNRSRTLIDSISRYFTIAILVIALVTGIVWSFYDLGEAILTFTAVLIIACPCALALATPFTLGAVMNVLGRNKLYLKNTQVIERLWKVQHIIFDKTGTLTKKSGQKVVYHGIPLTPSEIIASKTITENSVHPYSQIISQHLKSHDTSERYPDDFQEIPNQGISGSWKGLKVKLGSMRFVGSDQKIEDSDPKSGSCIYLSINDELKGYFSITNTYRSGLKGVVKQLQKLFRLSILSGDTDSEKPVLSQIFPRQSMLLFNQQPDDKLKMVQSCQRKGETVMMLGDGLNDAVSLKQADVGIAVTEHMSQFTPASDAILTGDQVQSLSVFMRLARASKSIILACFVISFLYNIIGISFAITGNLTPISAAILMPLSSISVVVFSTSMVKILAKIHKLS